MISTYSQSFQIFLAYTWRSIVAALVYVLILLAVGGGLALLVTFFGPPRFAHLAQETVRSYSLDDFPSSVPMRCLQALLLQILCIPPCLFAYKRILKLRFKDFYLSVSSDFPRRFWWVWFGAGVALVISFESAQGLFRDVELAMIVCAILEIIGSFLILHFLLKRPDQFGLKLVELPSQ